MTKTFACCPYCNKNAPVQFHTKDINRKVSKDKFAYHCCKTCALIFLFPIPENLGKYYPDGYYQIPSSLEDLAASATPEQYKVDIIRRFTTKGRLLEIGPSTGAFAYLAKKVGFEVEAIEMDPRCCSFLRDTLQIPTIESSDIGNALEKTASFNVIALWQVIEHLENPWAVLEALISHLEPGGIIVLAAPNPKALQFQLLKRFWTHIDAPRHLELIPMQLLSDFLQQRGLKTLLATTDDHGCRHWNHFGWTFTLTNLTKYCWMKKFLHFMGRAINKILKPIETTEGLGSTYTMVFQKVGAS